mmetsp:Transcript_18217/g.29618  ORF Transcript_18217/g.29618 Transcript_18217/m.29618 type:complete len:405 (-) Transcript_18217:1041-2255(-)|eukprot:CAMPEP_0203754180 /NCGR_PEP_ID=MMETSP0098-20131031/7818_1 /ASSEMBLY_ACC=CAM_ASM_000208 /TAXON_ID=96639 /ORGANISM=" , Strain NY0313808BC1" /LENGTH=404 /DNA_ID=CAMNT_0050645075 /DNA_START=273 /DNA_END=1487 /DNA_ORIENTATION=+
MAAAEMEEKGEFEDILADVGKEDAFIAGVLSGVVLGCEAGFLEAGQDCDSTEATERIQQLAQGLLQTATSKLFSSAASALSRLREDLGCSICWGLMQSPVSLQCGHSFCHPCIATWTKSQPSCPICRSPTLSYRSYSENVALREMLKRLGKGGSEETEETKRQLQELEEAKDENNNAFFTNGITVDENLLNQIRTVGRVRAVGTRHPYTGEIRRSLRQRSRQNELRQSFNRLYNERLVREMQQRVRSQEPSRMQVFDQLARVQMYRNSRRDDSVQNAVLDELRRTATPPLGESVPMEGRRTLMTEIISVIGRRKLLRDYFSAAAAGAASVAAGRNTTCNPMYVVPPAPNQTYHRILLNEIRASARVQHSADTDHVNALRSPQEVNMRRHRVIQRMSSDDDMRVV